MACARTEHVTTLLLAPETRGDFAQQLVLLFPAGLNCPRVDSLKWSPSSTVMWSKTTSVPFSVSLSSCCKAG
jgi:hypothetical protein